MMNINRIVDALLFHSSGAALAAVVGISCLQVIARYVFNASFAWVEEVSVIILAWAVWTAACIAYKQGRHLRVDIIDSRLSLKNRLLLRTLFDLLTLVLLIVIFFSNVEVLKAFDLMTLASLPEVPLSVMYASVSIGPALLIYYVLRSMIGDWQRLASIRKAEGVPPPVSWTPS